MGVVVLGLAIFLLVALPPAMSKYDSATKDRVLSMVARELPPNATMAEVDVFMRRTPFATPLMISEFLSTADIYLKPGSIGFSLTAKLS